MSGPVHDEKGGSWWIKKAEGIRPSIRRPFYFSSHRLLSKFFRFGERAVWMDVIAYVVVSVCDQVMMIIITMMSNSCW